MKAFYTDHFELPLPDGHRFPMAKYRKLRERIESTRFDGIELCIPPRASDLQLSRAHDAEYVARVTEGELTRTEILRIGFPWSPAMVERSRRSCGATIAAGLAALDEGVAVNLAGGTHHAGPNWGEGYCVFNDSVVAAREWQARGLVRNVAIVDCDVHQGNGTAAICHDDPSIFTFSIHGEKNFPSRKEPGDLDVALPDDCSDATYLEHLVAGLRRLGSTFDAEVAIYLAGADPYEHDRLGRLRLTKGGLLERDRIVLDEFGRRGIPVVITMAGGYATDVEDLVDIHFQTVRLAATSVISVRKPTA